MPALKNCFRVSSTALVERLVPGMEITVGILNGKTLPIIQILPQHMFYDFHSKYAQGGSRHVLPAPLSSAQARTAQKMARAAFCALGCDVYGRVDLIWNLRSRSGVILEINTIPGMTTTSLLPEAAKAVGIDFDELVLRIVQGSLSKNQWA